MSNECRDFWKKENVCLIIFFVVTVNSVTGRFLATRYSMSDTYRDSDFTRGVQGVRHWRGDTIMIDSLVSPTVKIQARYGLRTVPQKRGIVLMAHPIPLGELSAKWLPASNSIWYNYVHVQWQHAHVQWCHCGGCHLVPTGYNLPQEVPVST